MNMVYNTTVILLKISTRSYSSTWGMTVVKMHFAVPSMLPLKK